ncbi:TPA: hypothetical protein N0F65_008338 [Lagenidium giganteum]|uniref:sn-1-specific diacylglycerol lipase n=1 Tax=Lagenidium giganteum TaxID=4803 RepID=A0AAV2YSS0_9STRA|nr:TPA: hypothetical protein N0F65_008338 [Lagenidium giganteum]
MIELIENQRWYTLLGWSARLNTDDPPAWCTSQRMPSKSKDELPEFHWTVFKSEDYDEEGWLYGEAFGDDMGPMTRTSVVRTRIWLGLSAIEQEKKRGYEEEVAAKDVVIEENEPADAKSAASCESPSSLFPSIKDAPPSPRPRKLDKLEKIPSPCRSPTAATAAENHDDKVLFPTISVRRHSIDEAKSLFGEESPKAGDHGEDKVLFPTIPSKKSTRRSITGASIRDQMRKSQEKLEQKLEQSSFLGKVSAAALAIPSSMISLAGSSSKQAVMGTVQSLKEASLYALDSAQAATVAAISSEPVLPARTPPRSQTEGEDPFSMLSMLSKRFPDLTPVERLLVTCCVDEVPKFLSPPEPTNGKKCKSCGQEFGLTKFKYQCGYCSDSFCRDHLPHTEILRAFGQTTPSKVCESCYWVISQKVDQQQIQWRCERVDDFLHDKLILYFNTSTDTTVDKIMRAAEGTLAAAKRAPIGATAKMAVVSADFLRKYGRAGLLGFILRNEFMQSFSTLKGLIGDLDDIGFQDAAIGTYYFMAMNRGERGANPESERSGHKGCTPVSDELLHDMLRYAPLALHAIYELDVLDIQRISKLQGFSLIFAHIQNQDVRHPSFALLGNKEKKTALVLIRGSKSVQDLLTDIQAHPEEIGMANGSTPSDNTAGGFVDAFAHNGMLKAAMWIKDCIVTALRRLHNEGYQIVFAGHSLGAGCAALLSVMLQKEFENLRCFAYAVPACVNLHVAESCIDFVHSIVLRDDFVPRAKASNVVKLVEELKGFKGCWRDTASEDLDAFKDRAKTLWAPRKREWAQQEADSKKSSITPGEFKEVKKVDGMKARAAKRKSEDKSAGTSPTAAAAGDQSESSWTLTRKNLIDQMEKTVAEDEGAPTEARKAEEKVLHELAVSLMDDPKELYIPGRVTHIYFYKGIYEAVHVDRRCDALAHIPVFQNMLSDHLGRNYLSALRIVRDARKMAPTLPEWVPFSTKTRCMCCDSPFTWNSTSSSEAQQNRDQHNCRKCGWLVCEGCSEKWKSIPDFGINIPVRVCDRCVYEL